ncbi:unnamed protein product [Didymodactylos carnosus]|uniref:Uncharacterized protein n=1 Tax=Didymodactylos carnosus TaxID=1234261 RepID=A0A814BFW8_9BILA|nr:unnamed protein product [Didymodactylos carnosus]CAF0927839.1 unnamed protein product [Didymodactylos carnosus]CAF3619371.1 unnamed protein product [Didymodactylos carnosus]CAF3706240.1 unnamed protein product [Didymodactylos carnosus]
MSEIIDEEDDRTARSNSSSTTNEHQDINRRLSEIKSQIQTLLRQRKKYDDEKITQDNHFIVNEMVELQKEYQDINKHIIRNNSIKKQLRAQMSNLRSRSRARFSSLTTALKDKQRYEDELKRRDKSEQYRELVKNNLAAVDAALPLLKEEAELQARITTSEDAQKIATDRRDKIQDDLNKYQMKRKENEVLLDESAEKRPILDKKIEQLRIEREALLKFTRTSKKRRKSSVNRLSSSDTTNSGGFSNESNQLKALEEENIVIECRKTEEKLAQIKTMISYLREQMSEHDLIDTPLSGGAIDLISPLFLSPTTTSINEHILDDEQTELSYNDSDSVILSTYPTPPVTSKSPPVTIAMKLPRNFPPLRLTKSHNNDNDGNEIMSSYSSQTPSNDIIHSPYYDKKWVEYKKELDNDILNKYGGSTTTKKGNMKKSGKKNKKTFAIKHTSQMLQLYNTIRSSYPDTMQSMPMYEYEIKPALKTLEFIQQSLESYLNELDHRKLSPSSTVTRETTAEEEDRNLPLDDEQESDEIIQEEQDEHVLSSAVDSAVEDNYSETSSLDLLPQVNLPALSFLPLIKEQRSSSSSSSKKATNSPPSTTTSSHRQSISAPSQPQQDDAFLPPVDEDPHPSVITAVSLPPNIFNIDRQISDEGYRSCRGGRGGGDCTPGQQHLQQQSGAVRPTLCRSKSYDSSEKVDHWLQQHAPSTKQPLSLHQSSGRNRQQRKVFSDEYYRFRPTTDDND